MLFKYLKSIKKQPLVFLGLYWLLFLGLQFVMTGSADPCNDYRPGGGSTFTSGGPC